MKIRPTNKGWAVATAAVFVVFNFLMANPIGFFVALIGCIVFLLQRPSDFD